jgi:hypothetical protein
VKRELRPRATAALPVAPVTCSDLTAPIIFGFEPRQYREFLRAEQIPHAIVGQRVLARVEHVLAAIDRLAAKDVSPSRVLEEDDVVEPSSAALLAMIGRVRR